MAERVDTSRIEEGESKPLTPDELQRLIERAEVVREGCARELDKETDYSEAVRLSGDIGDCLVFQRTLRVALGQTRPTLLLSTGEVDLTEVREEVPAGLMDNPPRVRRGHRH